MPPISDAQKRANEKYIKSLDEIKIRVPKGKKEILKAHAERIGESLNSYMKQAVARRYREETGEEIEL